MENQSPTWTWEDAALFLGAYLPVLLLGALLSKLLPAGVGGIAGRMLLAQFIGYALCLMVIAFLIQMRSTETLRQALAWRIRASMLPSALFGGPLLAIGLNLVALFLKAPDIENKVKDWLADAHSLPWVALFIVVLAPVVEELVFRGFFQPLAVRTAGAAGGILLIAILFALLHGPTYLWSAPHLTVMALAGCAFGWMRHRTGSTAAAALLHASYNATMLYAYLR